MLFLALEPAALSAQPAAATAPVAPASPSSQASPSPRQIVVTGTRRQYDSGLDRRTYSIASDLQGAHGSISDVLRNIPSVDVDLQGNVSLRGDTHVTILVDGKPTSLFEGPGGGLTLQQVPASQYERVEIMTNPSAAFAANGSGGIINLITRRNRTNGAVGSVRASFGTRGRRSGGASLSDKLGKATLSVNATWRGDPQFSTDVVRFQEPTGAASREITNGVGNLNLWTARAAADIDLGGSNSLGAEIHHTSFLYHSNMHSTLLGNDGGNHIIRDFERTGFLQQNRFDTEGSLSFRHDTSGKADDYSASLTYEKTLEDNRQRFQDISLLPPEPDVFDNVTRLNRLGRLEAKADLTSPRASGASLQAGADLQIDNDRFHDLGGFGPTAAIAGTPVAQFTELFHFDRTVAAAYAIYQRPFGRLTAQAGLRVEGENRRSGELGAPGSAGDSDVRIFPSAHVEWEASSGTSLKASVSTRVLRPDPVDFDPFRRFVDPFHFEAGNPALKSETTVSLEGSIEHKEKSSLEIATLYYRRNRGGVTDLSEEVGPDIILTTRENLIGSTQVGIELVRNGALTRTLAYKLSANVYRLAIDASNLGFGRTSAMIESGKAGFDWQPAKKDLAQVSISMSGKKLYPQGEADPMLLVNLGYRHQLTQKLFAFFTAQDALHTYKARAVIRSPALVEHTLDSAKTQAAFIGLTYNFGGKSGREPAFDYSG